MTCAIRIKHYIDGYERLVPPSDYELWRKTEKRMGEPIFQVLGILTDREYIDIKEIVDMLVTNDFMGVINYDTTRI